MWVPWTPQCPVRPLFDPISLRPHSPLCNLTQSYGFHMFSALVTPRYRSHLGLCTELLVCRYNCPPTASMFMNNGHLNPTLIPLIPQKCLSSQFLTQTSNLGVILDTSPFLLHPTSDPPGWSVGPASAIHQLLPLFTTHTAAISFEPRDPTPAPTAYLLGALPPSFLSPCRPLTEKLG